MGAEAAVEAVGVDVEEEVAANFWDTASIMIPGGAQFQGMIYDMYAG